MALSQKIKELLVRLGNPDFAQEAERDLKELIVNDISDGEKLNTFVGCVGEAAAPVSPKNRKHEQAKIKLFLVLAEIFQYQLIEFMPTLLKVFVDRFREADEEFSATVAETLGAVMAVSLRDGPINETVEGLGKTVQAILKDFEKQLKASQQTAALALVRIVDAVPVEPLQQTAAEISGKILTILGDGRHGPKGHLLEALGVIWQRVGERVQAKALQFTDSAIAVLRSEVQGEKLAGLDLLVALVQKKKENVAGREEKLIEILTELKSDKAKATREKAVEILSIIRPRESLNKIAPADRSPTPTKALSKEGTGHFSIRSDNLAKSPSRPKFKIDNLKFDYSNIHSTIDRKMLNKEFLRDDSKKEDTFIAFKEPPAAVGAGTERLRSKDKPEVDPQAPAKDFEPQKSNFSFEKLDHVASNQSKDRKEVPVPTSASHQSPVPPLQLPQAQPDPQQNPFWQPPVFPIEFAGGAPENMSYLLLNMQYMARRIADLEAKVGALQNQNSFLSNRLLAVEQRAAIAEGQRQSPRQIQPLHPIRPGNAVHPVAESTGYRLGLTPDIDSPRSDYQTQRQLYKLKKNVDF